MAKLSGVFQFDELTAPGCGLVQEFQRKHLGKFKFTFGPDPAITTIGWEGVDKLPLLLDLVKQVQTEDSLQPAHEQKVAP